MAKKIVIASGKGGVGKSSVTAGLACALVSVGKRVLTVDCDVGLSSLDIMLGTDDDVLFNWGDVVLGRCELSQAVVPSVKGPDLLCAPKLLNSDVNAERFKAAFGSALDEYDYVFFDAPAGIGEGLRLASAYADSAIVIATPDEISVRSSAAAARSLSDYGITSSKLIINRFNPKATIKGKLLNIDDVIDSTYLRLLGIVPQDLAVNFNLNRGKPLPPSSTAYRAFARIAGRLEGKRIKLKFD